MKINLQYETNHIQLDLIAPRTVIEGESATGKTYIFKAFQAAQRYMQRNQQLQDQDVGWAEKFLFLNSLSAPKDISEVVASSNKVVLIDNANYLLENHVELREKLNDLGDGNIYLIFGRTPLNIDSQGVRYGELSYINKTFSIS